MYGESILYPDEHQHCTEMQLQMGSVQQHSEVSRGHLLSLEEQEVLKQLEQKLVNFLSAWSEKGRRSISTPCCFAGVQ